MLMMMMMMIIQVWKNSDRYLGNMFKMDRK